MGIAQLQAQECRLCKRQIASARQMPLNAIIIEGYSMCPNCRRHVDHATEEAFWYRSKWLRFVQAVSRKNGWFYQVGEGFKQVPR